MAEKNYTCANCNGAITPRINKTTGLPSKAKRKFCSSVCASRYHENINPRRCRPSGSRKPSPVICGHCKKTVMRHVRGSRDAGRFCSRDCAFAAGSERKVSRAAEVRAAAEVRKLIRAEVSSLRRIAASHKLPVNASIKAAEITAKLKRTCADCGSGFTQRTHMGSPEKRCDDCEVELLRKVRRIYKLRRKSITRGAIADSIDPIKVFERDKWRCHICNTKTPRKLRGTHHDTAPELEHIVSLSDGGSHTWGNVACSCRKCNQQKGAGSFGQLGFRLPL